MGDRVNVAVRVIPRSKTDRVDAARAGRLVIRVAAPPESGAANRAAQKLLAAALGIRAAEIRVERGATSRDKTLSIPGAARAALLAILGEARAEGGSGDRTRGDPPAIGGG